MKQLLSPILVVLVVLAVVHVNQDPAGRLIGSAAAETTDDLQPLITTSELLVGENRFAFGLMKANKLLEGAAVRVRIFSIDGPEARLVADANPAYRAIGSISGVDKVHRHEDGTTHAHGTGSDVRGLYTTHLTFARPGVWGLEIQAREGHDSLGRARFTVTVLDRSQTPAPGEPAPRSRNVIARDVEDLHEIDTSTVPDLRLHRARIADAIAQGKPQLIAFATPQFCTSRMCGPVLEVVRQLLPRYGDRVAFTHQEIWRDFAKKEMFPTVEQWRLTSEPWIFVVDSRGIVSARFEGLVTVQELEYALHRVTASGASH